MRSLYEGFGDPFRVNSSGGGNNGAGITAAAAIAAAAAAAAARPLAPPSLSQHHPRTYLADPFLSDKRHLSSSCPSDRAADAGGAATAASGLESLAHLAAATDDARGPVNVHGTRAPLQPQLRQLPLAVPAERGRSHAHPVSAPVEPSPPARRARSPCSPRSARAAPSAKRQRIGPSCDSCRLKKIKCDASVSVLHQDEALVAFSGNKNESLHATMTYSELKAALPSHVWKNLPARVLEALESQDSRAGEVVRHVDKVVFFRACASCARRNASGSGSGKESDGESGTSAPATPAGPTGSVRAAAGVAAAAAGTTATPAAALGPACCTFSKGFTRSDINVFTRLQKQLGPRGQLADFTVAEYRSIGY